MADRALVDIEIIRDESDEPLVVAMVRGPMGTLKVLAEISFEDGCLVLDDLHIHGIGLDANTLGPGRLRRIAREVADELKVEAVVIRGARRTSGAYPGHRPRPIRIARRAAPERDDQGC